MLLASGGLHVACGVWEPLMERLPGHPPLLYLLLLVALHVTAIAGGCVAAALMHRCPKRTIYVSRLFECVCVFVRLARIVECVCVCSECVCD